MSKSSVKQIMSKSETVKTDDLKVYYPGHVMETGYDIIFHWVARMIFFRI